MNAGSPHATLDAVSAAALHGVPALAPLGIGHGQSLLQLRNGSVQGLCSGLAGSLFHERSLPC